MKVSTLMTACFMAFFFAALSAKPCLPTYSVAADTLSLTEQSEPEEACPAPGSRLDAPAVNDKVMMPPTWVSGCDNCGSGTGFIDLTPSTPGPWLYMWSNGDATQDISGLTAGFYTVTIFDQGLMQQVVAQINVAACPPVAPLSITGVVTGNTLCNGTSNGAIDVTVDPPNGWNYFWSSGETTQDLTNVDPGIYTVSVTWGVTCTTEATFVVPNLTNAPTLGPPLGGFGLDFCQTGNGTAAVTVTGGVGPFTYDWSNGATDQMIMNLVEGQYTVTVTGSNGCSATLEGPVPPGTLPVTVSLNTLVPNTTCIGANGSISINVNPPGLWLSSATYQWSNGATTQNISNLSTGSYRVTVTRLGVCTATEVWFIENEPVLPGLSLAITSASCGNSNGGVNLTTLPGGIAPYTFLWSNGATTEDLTNIPGGNYDVTITSGNGCTSTGNAVVDNNQAIFGYSAVVNDNTSCDTINGRIALSLFPANLAFQWSNGATTTVLDTLQPGNYTVTISAGGTCTAVETYNVGDIREYPVIPVLVDTATCGLANGGIDLMILGNAITPLTYTWSTGDTTQDLTKLQADTFFVTVTSAVGCSNQRFVIVPNVNDTIRVMGAVIDNFSCTAPTGAIDLNLTQLDSAYVFQWSSGQTIDSLVNLTGGDYLVTVTLGLSCIALDTFTVVNNALPPNLSATSNATNCGLNNGTADLSVAGGTAPFTYIWSNMATTEDLAGLTPGTYSVTVTGSNSCTSVNTVTVLNNNIPLSVNGTPAGNTSCAAANGSVDIGVTPVGTYNYAWSNAALTEDISNLSAGTYTVTVSLGTCLSTSTFLVPDNALSPNLSASSTAATCSQSDGSADLNVSGGVGPFTYNWSNMAVTEDLSGLAPGSYLVTVTGANSCTSVSSTNVLNNNITLNLNAASVANTSCTAVNGSIDLTVSPAGAYNYLWSNAQTTEDLSNLSSGSFIVTVTLGTCQSTSIFLVADNTSIPNVGFNVTASICGVNNGGIDLSVTGLPGPFTYLWSDMSTTEDLSSLLPGNYTVTVTALNGCTQVANINVPNNASTFSLAATPSPLTNCSVNNGAIDLNVTPAGAFTYLWSNMATTEDLNGLAPGTYTVSVTQSGSCTATASYFVINQITTPLSTQAIVPELCGQADGSIDLSIVGGTAPFGYQWLTGQVTQDLSNLAAGTYNVTVTDANNCTVTANAVVPGNSISFALSGTPSDNNSCLVNNGAIDLSVNPPGGVTYLWSNLAQTEDLSNLPAGTYTVTVSAGGNCTNTAAFAVISNIPSPLLAQNITAAFCGQASGAIDLSVSGSPAPYGYLWSNNALVQDLNAIIPGTYSVTVTAANGCTTVDNFVVPDNVFVPGIASTLTPATSCVLNNGAIDLTINPAVGPYTFIWSNMATTEDLANVAAGSYTVTVSAGGTCTNTSNLIVASNTGIVSLSGQPTAVLCFGGNTGSIDLSVNSGTAPFIYNWSPAIAGNPQDPSGLNSGNYTVTVTDNLGCTSTSLFAISQPATPVQIQCAATAPVSQIGLTDGSGSVNINGGTGPYTVNWSPGSSQTLVPTGTFPISNLGANTYGVTVTDANGCPTTCGFTIITSACATAVGSMGNTLLTRCGPGCITATYNTTGQVLNSNDALQFVLHQGSGATIVNEIARSNQPNFCFDAATMSFGTTYYISALAGLTDAMGNVVLSGNCTVNSAGTPIRFNEAPVATANPPAQINCANPQTALQGSSSLAGSTFLWSTLNGTIVGNPAQANTSANQAGLYTLIVTTNGCSDTTAVTLAGNFTQPVASVNAATTQLTCSSPSISLQGTVTGSANANNQWVSNGVVLGNTNTLSVTTPGLYNFVSVDALSFCADTASITITQSVNPPGLAIANPALLTCTTPSQTLSGSSPVSGVQFTWATISGPDTTIVGTGANLPVSAAGTYFLIGINPANSCANATSVNVLANQTPPVANAGAPFTLDCAGETTNLNGSGTGAPNLNYQWTSQNGNFVSGANTATPLINKSGDYQLLVTNPANGCTDTDAVTITPEVPVVFVSMIQPTCSDLQGTVQVDSVTGLSAPILYSLNNSQPGAQNQFTNLAPGVYNLEVLGGNGCSATAVVTVEVPVLVDITLTPAATVVLGDSYQIDAVVNIPNADIASITWTPSTGLVCDTCLSTLASPLTTTEYQLLVVSNVGCEAREKLLLTVDKTRRIFVPNIFSPNDDGRNDVFTVFASQVRVEKVKSLQVFSRWGEAIFELRDFEPGDLSTGWDGTFKGEKLNPAVFVWQAVVQFVDGKEEVFTGDVTLQR